MKYRIKEIAYKQGLPLGVLAKKANVSACTISNIISGRFSTRMSALECIAKALGCKVADMLDED